MRFALKRYIRLSETMKTPFRPTAAEVSAAHDAARAAAELQARDPLPLTVRIDATVHAASIIDDLKHVFESFPGDCEVVLDSADNVPYVIGLVRQALERQMGNGPADELT